METQGCSLGRGGGPVIPKSFPCLGPFSCSLSIGQSRSLLFLTGNIGYKLLGDTVQSPMLKPEPPDSGEDAREYIQTWGW